MNELIKSDNLILESFLDIETELELFDKKIDDYYFWIYLRHDMIEDVLRSKNAINSSQNNNNLGDTRKEMFFNLMRFAMNCIKYIGIFPFIRQKDIVIIDHPRKIKNEKGLYECKYTDMISENLKKSLVIEFPYPYKHYYPAKNKKILYMDFISLATRIISKNLRMFRSDRKIYNDANKYVECIDKLVQKKIGIELDKEKYVNTIIRFYYMYKIQKRLLRDFLKKVKPRKIIEVVSYAPENLVINEIANELKIETIELQHGTMGKEHIAYNFATEKNIPQFPNKVLLFSDYWKKTTRFPIKQENVISVGFPYFEEKLNKKKEQLVDKINNKKVILFLSQPSIGDKLVNLAIDLNNLITNDIMLTKYEILYKLHPGETTIWKERYKELLNSNIKVVSNEMDLYDLFLKSDIQIGCYSTAIYEGLGFNLDTYIYRLPQSKIFEDLSKRGFIKYIDNAEEIVECINQEGNQKVDREIFWKCNSLNNILNEINRR